MFLYLLLVSSSALLHAPMSEDTETLGFTNGFKDSDSDGVQPTELEKVGDGRVGDLLSLLTLSSAEHSLAPINSLFLNDGLLSKTSHWPLSASRARTQLLLSFPTSTSYGSVVVPFKTLYQLPSLIMLFFLSTSKTVLFIFDFVKIKCSIR